MRRDLIDGADASGNRFRAAMKIERHDVADFGLDQDVRRVEGELAAGDLVITADIPLAAAVLGKGGHALNPRGELYSAETIGGRLNVRDFMETLRSTGVDTGGPPTFHRSDRQAFANQLDSWLHRRSQSQTV